MSDRLSPRVVSLLPSATEILFDIGADVVGVTHECDHPPGALALPAVTASTVDDIGETSAEIDRHIRRERHLGSSPYRLDATRLAGLAPDLIITQELCNVCAVSYEQVADAVCRLQGAVPIISLEPHTLDDIIASVETVGRATGCAPRADRLAAELRARISAVIGLPAVVPPPTVVCIEWTDPLMVGGHWVPQMVEIAGGRDALGRTGTPSRPIEWNEVLAADPDVMVLMPCGYDLLQTVDVAHEVTWRDGFDQLACARRGAVVAVNGSGLFSRPGPRVVSGLELIAQVLRSTPGEPLPADAQWID